MFDAVIGECQIGSGERRTEKVLNRSRVQSHSISMMQKVIGGAMQDGRHHREINLIEKYELQPYTPPTPFYRCKLQDWGPGSLLSYSKLQYLMPLAKL